MIRLALTIVLCAFAAGCQLFQPLPPRDVNTTVTYIDEDGRRQSEHRFEGSGSSYRCVYRAFWDHDSKMTIEHKGAAAHEAWMKSNAENAKKDKINKPWKTYEMEQAIKAGTYEFTWLTLDAVPASLTGPDKKQTPVTFTAAIGFARCMDCQKEKVAAWSTEKRQGILRTVAAEVMSKYDETAVKGPDFTATYETALTKELNATIADKVGKVTLSNVKIAGTPAK